MTYPKDSTLASYQPLMDNLKSLASTADMSITAFGEEWAAKTAASAYNEIELLQDFIASEGMAFKFVRWKKEISE